MKVAKCDVCGKVQTLAHPCHIHWYDVEAAKAMEVTDLCDGCFEKLIEAVKKMGRRHKR